MSWQQHLEPVTQQTPSPGSKLPNFIDDGDVWDPSVEQCVQPRYEDYTGVDSLGAFFLSIIVYLVFQWLEDSMGRPLFTFPGGTPYDRAATKTVEDEVEKADPLEKPIETAAAPVVVEPDNISQGSSKEEFA